MKRRKLHPPTSLIYGPRTAENGDLVFMLRPGVAKRLLRDLDREKKQRRFRWRRHEIITQGHDDAPCRVCEQHGDSIIIDEVADSRPAWWGFDPASSPRY